MTRVDEVVAFWLDEVGPDRWFNGGPQIDATVAERFGAAVHTAREGGMDDWMLTPRGALALLILLDQFPRHIWRGDPRAYASDRRALCVAKRSIRLDYDKKIPEPERQFFYMPFMHSESKDDQDRCVRLILTRMPETGAVTLKHAVHHRDIIRQFGRFPYRNDALRRAPTRDEAVWLAAGGYRA